MKTKTFVACLSADDHHKLANLINKFGAIHDTFATQIYDRGQSWVAFVHYRVQVRE